MRVIICLAFTIFSYTFSFGQLHNRENLSIGESLLLHSEILKEDRTINVYLPNGYDLDSTKTYPVIYLLDGSIDEDFIHVSGLVQFGSFPWINLINESIVIGISNVDRKRDFTYPSSDKKDLEQFPTTGGSELFVEFIEKELFRCIELNYRINEKRTIIGQSLGGLLATEILFKKPHLFHNYLIISPSLWWDNYSLLKSEPLPFSDTKSIYVGVGNEGVIMKRLAKKLYKKMKKSVNASSIVKHNYFKNNNHGDVLHLALYDAFEKLFSVKD